MCIISASPSQSSAGSVPDAMFLNTWVGPSAWVKCQDHPLHNSLGGPRNGQEITRLLNPCLEQWLISMVFSPPKLQNSFGMAEKKPLPSHPQPIQAQGVKSWKMHVHEKSVWEVFGDEARWMAGRRGVLAPKVTREKNGRKVMIKVMTMML